LNKKVGDEFVSVDDLVAREHRAASRAEGRQSSSASRPVRRWAGALDVAKRAPKGSVLLVMLPDTGERYLSTILFEGIAEGSDDAWLASLG